MRNGIVFLVGAGPGDPGLLTRKGEWCLRQAQVVVYDRLVGTEILNLAPPDAELIFVGKESSHHTLKQDEINRLLAEKAAEGLTVVRLKGGDPYLFGRGGEEALYLRERGIPFEVVPGITSAIAVPAYAGIPVTHRDYTSTLAIVTGHEQPGKKESSIKWEHLAPAAGTIVFLMGVNNLDHIAEQLMRHGKPEQTPVALVEWGTLPKQRVVSAALGDIVEVARREKITPPALMVVGEVVALRPYLNWFEQKPLFGRRVVVTRSREQASQLSGRLAALGAEVIEFPTIEIRRLDMKPLREELKRLGEYDWLIFTSANGVEIFFEQLTGENLDARSLAALKVVAIGPGTKDKLREFGIRADIVPSEYRAEALVEAVLPHMAAGDRVLLPRAANARKVLVDELKNAGISVSEILLYEAVPTVPASDLLDEMREGNFDIVTFTSSSTVENFVGLVGEDFIKGWRKEPIVACIGPVTAEKARVLGLKPTLVADKYTIDGLTEELVQAVGRERV